MNKRKKHASAWIAYALAMSLVPTYGLADTALAEELSAAEVYEQEAQKDGTSPDDAYTDNYELNEVAQDLESDVPKTVKKGSGKTAVSSVQTTGSTVSGYCGADNGKNVQWKLDLDTGKLTLTGTGEMDTWNDSVNPFGQEFYVPWRNYQQQITSVSIGSGITYIGWWAFAHTNITEITFPSSVKEIGQGALAYCSKLRTVNLNNGLTSIEGSVFEQDALDELVFPASLASISGTSLMDATIGSVSVTGSNPKLRVEDNVIFSADMTRLFCSLPSKTGSYTIPKGVRTIEEYAFIDSKLTSIVIPEGVTTLIYRSFAGAGIEEIVIPDSVTTMEYGAFTQCPNLSSVKIGKGLKELPIDAFGQCNSLTNVELSNGLKTIEDAFRYCESLQSIRIPDTVTKLGEGAFVGCSSLEHVELGSGLKEIGYAAFSMCSSLTDIDLPDGLTTIGEGAFYNTGLTQIDIPASVTSIAVNAFPSSTVVNLPDTLSPAGDGSYVSQSLIAPVYINMTYGQTDARNMLTIINNFRTGNNAWYWNSDNKTKKRVTNLGTLTYDATLEKIAMQRAAEAAVRFSHSRPNGINADNLFASIPEFSQFSNYGENLAAGSSSASAAFTNLAEENEPYSGQGHRRNMLSSDFNAVGIGHVVLNGVHFWAQEFGYTNSPNQNLPAANNSQSSVPVAVSKNLAKISNTTVDPAGMVLEPGETLSVPNIRITFSMNDTFGGNMTGVIKTAVWNSSDPAVASVSGCKVTALKYGKATLKTNVLGKSLTATVMVGDLAKPASVTAVNTASGINISWKASHGAAGYKVYQKNGSSWKLVKTTTATSFTDTATKSKDGTFFTYRIEAYSGKHISPQIETTLYRLNSPKIKSAKSAAKKKVSVKWKNNSKASGYEIQYGRTKRLTTGAKTTKIKKNKTVKKTLSKLKPGKTYYVRIRAYRKVGRNTYYSAWSTIRKVKCKR